MTAERMVRLTTLGQQGSELFPDGLLFEVRLECGHGVYAPLHREALDTPRMIEHLVPVYTLTASLLAEPLSLRFNHEDGERSRKVAARLPRRHNGSLWNIPISCSPFADRSTSA